MSKSCGLDFLHNFGKEGLTEENIYMAERFLVRCMTKDESITTFDQLR